MLLVVAKNQWISVQFRMPQPGERCLVFCRNDGNKPGDQTNVTTTIYAPGSTCDWPYLCERWDRHVTHWMPTPDDPPKE